MLKEQRDLRLVRQNRTHPHETCSIMRSGYIFLLLYLLWGCFVPSSQQGEGRCNSTGQDPDAASCFLQCVGSPPSNTGRDHMRNLKTMLEAAIDIYTFMRSSAKGAHLSLEGAIFLDPDAEPLHNEALVEMWMEVKVAPLLKSINRHVLVCLSNKNFSCSTYQTMVKELSRHFSEMNPARQKWIYSFFMYPFLSRNGVTGCVNPNESSEEWLMKNFGAFNVMARISDLPALNMVFSGLEVLHLLSPAQKAELLLRPEVAGLSKDSLSLIFHSLMSDGPPANTTNNYEGTHNWTEPEYPQTTYSPYLPPSPHNTLTEVIEGTRMAFQPIMSFIHNFVTFTKRRHVSGIRSSTLMQFLLNWTLAEMASHYRPYYSPVPLEVPELDEMKDWYRNVVLPILRRFSSDEQSLMSDHLLLAFRHVFNLDHNVDNGTVDVQDVCRVALDGNPCGLTDAGGNVARIMHCAARTNLTMSEGNVMRLILELTEHLNLLIQEFVTANFTEVASDFRQIFSEADSHSFTQDNLHDPEFVTIWFHIKLSPLLPHIPTDLLSCLSGNNFSCPAYQALVALLSQHMSYFEPLSLHHQNIYTHFVYFFLRRHNMSDACFSANNSTEWLWKNFGSFSHVADIADFYDFNPNFSGLEVLDQLSPRQMAQLMFLPRLTPPEKDDVIREVFDFLLESPRERRLLEVLHALRLLATEVQPPCAVSQTILEQLQRVIVSVPPDMEFLVRDKVDQFIQSTPKECVSDNIKCLVIQINATDVCKGIDSSDLHLDLSTSVDIPCNFTLEDYACSQLQNFTANQLASLLSCNLTGNSKRSRVLWKILLSHLSPILDPALDMLASINTIGPSAPEILDVIGETRVALLSDEQLRNSSVIARWFSGRLKGFLPFASDNFLRCLSYRNLSCQSYQEILEIFKRHYDNITHTRRIGILQQFVVNFLSGPVSGPSCLLGFNSSTEWLMVNVGPFSRFLTLKEILQLNPDFNPLEALPLLSLRQRLDLLFTPSPGLPEIDVIIDAVFDHLTNSPEERLKIPEFLTHLVGRLQPPVNGNLSCSSYKMLFTRLDLALQTVPLRVMSSITSSKMELAELLPPGCIIYSGECTVTPINATEICMAVNSTALQLLLDNGMHEGRLCNFAVEQFACASLTALTDQDLAVIFTCNPSGHLPFWKLLLTKSSHLLNESLDLLTNMTFNLGNSAASVILDAIREVQLDAFPGAFINDLDLIELWFKHRLHPFLHAVSPDFLSCLTTKDLDCTSYQHIVQALSHVQPNMSIAAQTSFVSHFIKIFLTRNDTDDPSCITHSSNSSEWLQLNFGAFSHLVLLSELQMLHPNFSPFEALPQLTVRQLADLSSTPGALTSPAQVAMVMEHVPNQSLPTFFDDFSPSIKGKESFYPAPVRSAILEVVFDRASLSEPSVRDSVVSAWLRVRLPPLLFQLSPRHVSPFFKILSAKNCSVERQGVKELNTTISSLSDRTQKEVHNHIVQALKEPVPLRCYANNQSYYGFLQSSFMGFQLPNLTTFLSLIPQNKRNQLVNSVAPSELGSYLRQPDIVDDDAELCSILGNYLETPLFLEKETLPVAVRRPTLPCVWPLALGSSSRSEVKAWFDRRLANYLNFLTRDLIGNVTTYNTSCLAFQEFVSVLGLFNFSAVDFVRRDVFDTITIYLNSASAPKCYNASDPELNSTAWFAEYIGPFIEFITLQDFFTFGSPEVLQLFTVDQQNIAIFNQTVLPVNVVNYYTELLYKQDSNFNPIFLPLSFRCFVPGMAFSQLSADESMLVLHNLTTLCVDLDPQVAAALAGTLGDEIDAASIAALGKESTGISVGQIKTIDGKDLHEALGTLSNVTGWHTGQAKAIVLSLMSSGLMQINNASSLLMLGSLIIGVPANTFSNIDGSEVIAASKDPMFLMHLTTAPRIIQLVVVSQIISVNSSSDDVVENIPDDLATEIPGSLLLGVSSTEKVLAKLNKKKWKRKQAELLFEVVAVESATTLLGNADNLSSSVLQGFTCSSVRTFQKSQVKKLIRACRRKGRNKVKLAETQLTCMYNHIKDESDVTSFELYPHDMLLYFNYSLVPQDNCRSYFEELAEADFSVFSSVLSSVPTVLFENAKSCLGITNQSLSENDISVLGNMCCTLDGVYISNSDASILGKLQNCSELSEGQVTAVEALLESGNTTYGPPSNWTKGTLEDLGIVPLFMTSNFYENFNRETKRSFLGDFLKLLKENGVDKQKRKSLKKEIRKSIRNKVKRSLENECTVGSITQVTISDEVFPFDYFDVNQFNCCLNATIVRDNLGSITEKVDQDKYLKIVLEKLREAYVDHSSIPADQVELLGQASRQATSDDINLWNVTLVDTLSSLMDSSNGPWNSSLAKQIITKYLSHDGNTLGSTELNVIGGDNLCSLDANVLQGISAQSLRNASVLNVSICTPAKKQVLFVIALKAFGGTTGSNVSTAEYQFMEPYLGGAPLDYLRTLVTAKINMNLETFVSLDPSAVMAMSVGDVRDLLGTNLPNIKRYENQELVREWSQSQRQSELNQLGVGLQGGRADPTVAPTGITADPNQPSSTTQSSSGTRVSAKVDALFLLLILLFTSV